MMEDTTRYIALIVRHLKPGQAKEFSREMMRGVICIPGWSAEETVMENVIGSAYEYEYATDPMRGTTSFKRRPNPLTGGLRCYVSPDRQHYFNRRPDGLWEVKMEAGK